MAASANPSGNQEGNNGNNNGVNPNGGVNPNNNGSNGVAVDNSGAAPVLKHVPNPGLSVQWTSEEQSILDEELAKKATEPTWTLYARVALLLNDKTARDVAMRCRWMTKKENSKKRKEEHNGRKSKKEKSADPSGKLPSHIAARPNAPPHAQPMISLDNDDGISYKDIGGATGQLLEQNAQFFTQIYANFASFKIHDNINLLCQARDNILTILNDLNDIPGVAKPMPPIPVKVNEEIANSILPRTSRTMQP
ncbi:hypothetical protein GIB67_008382 [Kingdonia uniflora]|uniref:Myb-like domain-containing protein n=1 Tax=Kingdonia uniflora TaxID=39325 RepID=A0A7J7N558_9MAGN|nr:hypothetical protein GIB67_008382 [Kingdonia uniflora]